CATDGRRTVGWPRAIDRPKLGGRVISFSGGPDLARRTAKAPDQSGAGSPLSLPIRRGATLRAAAALDLLEMAEGRFPAGRDRPAADDRRRVVDGRWWPTVR